LESYKAKKKKKNKFVFVATVQPSVHVNRQFFDNLSSPVRNLIRKIVCPAVVQNDRRDNDDTSTIYITTFVEKTRTGNTRRFTIFDN